MTPSELADAQDRGRRVLFDSWRAAIPHHPLGILDERHGVLVAATGLPWPQNNPAFALEDSVDARAAVAWGIERRGGLGSGYDLPSGRNPRVERALSTIGHEVIAARPMMLAETAAMEAVLVRAPRELEVRRVTDCSQITDVARVQARAFDSTVEMEAAQLPASQLDHSDFFLALGTVDGVAVSAAQAVRTPDGIAIFGVATDPDYRGLGYASTTTAFAIRTIDPKAAVAVLQSTAAGYPVYRSMGFIDIGPWEVWSPAS